MVRVLGASVLKSRLLVKFNGAYMTTILENAFQSVNGGCSSFVDPTDRSRPKLHHPRLHLPFEFRLVLG